MEPLGGRPATSCPPVCVAERLRRILKLWFRDELSYGVIFHWLAEARIILESRGRHFNTVRPHQSLGHKPPHPEVFIPAFGARSAAPPRPAPPSGLAPKPILHLDYNRTSRWSPFTLGFMSSLLNTDCFFNVTSGDQGPAVRRLSLPCPSVPAPLQQGEG